MESSGTCAFSCGGTIYQRKAHHAPWHAGDSCSFSQETSIVVFAGIKGELLHQDGLCQGG